MSTEPLPGVGSTLGPYRIEALLGRGGMGVVYRARDLRLDRMVALKLLRSSVAGDPRYRERFLRESRLAAAIDHARIVPVYDAGELDGQHYIAMRFVDGVDLAELVRREGPLDPGRAVRLVSDLAGALDAAHARGLIHRDVKPSNALVAVDDEGEHAYLVDFGITQDLTERERLTATDQLVGTLDYLAPERIRGDPYDGRADIYALGCVLFECLTGEAPFRATSDAAAIYGHLEQQPPRPSEVRAEVPRALDGVVARALAKDPADRFQSGADLRAAAQAAVAGEPRPARRALPRRTLLAGAVLVAAAAIGALALTRGGSLERIDENAVGLIDRSDGSITAQYDVGRDPGAVASGAGSVWIANHGDGTVSRIDRGAGQIVTIDVGGGPTGLAFAAGSLWVADGEARTVAQISPESNRVIERHPIGHAGDAVTAGFGALWVTSAVDATLTRLDLTGRGAKRTIAVDARPSAIATGAGAVWVTSEATGRVLRLDPRNGTALGSIQVGKAPAAVAVGRDAVWVADRRDGTVSRIDPVSEVVETRRVGPEPRALVADAGGVWVGVGGAGRVVRLDAGSLEETERVAVGSSPSALALVGDDVWTAAVPGAEAHRGGTLRIWVPELPLHLDPAVPTQLQPLLYDGLTAYRRAGGAAGGTLVQGLAAALPEPAPDGRTYVFRLRPGVRFSDGTPVRPQDVRASIERLLAVSGEPDLPPIRGGHACTPKDCDLAEGIEVDPAAGTVTVHLERPDPDLLHKLQQANVAPARTPREVRDSTVPPGTGPYMARRWDAGSGGLLVRNPHFRPSADRPDGFPDRIEIRPGPVDRPVPAIEAGRVDIAPVDPPLEPLRTRHGERVRTDPAPQTTYVFLDVRRPPFDDVRVRRALNYAVDRARVAELMRDDAEGVPACQLLPPGFQGHVPRCAYTANPNAAGTWSAPDLPRARRLIAASGTRGMRLAFVTAPPFEEVGDYFTRLLRRLGYRSSLRTLGDLFLVSQQPDPPQIGVWGWFAATAAPYTFLQPLITCSGELNLSRHCDRRLDAAMRRAAASRGPEAVELWRRAHDRLVEQAPTVPLLNIQVSTLVSRRVGNYQHHPLWGPLYEQLWVR